MDPDTILLEAEERMDKALDHLKTELRGVRTGRASTALVEYVRVDYYGSPTDLKSLASISVPEPTQLLIKPYDAGSLNEIRKALESSDLGLNPQTEGKQIRIMIPSLSTERRQQLVAHCKKVAEETKVAMRNVRRDANKQADGLKKATDSHYPEDEIETLKQEIEELLKKHEGDVERLSEEKAKEIMTV